ncbi:MAG: ArsC/Spx/MgsR family protein [Methylovulum miyakonense]|uniref:ArsC/Spx/MgsR family protein n=1 Tax=Methylovulum miyakonense TaxID=645578 RepID=UPI003BB73ED7
MATVVFYEKPGCINNRRQKELLVAAGHQVIAKNLLSEAWHADRLRAFFGSLPVRNWFNYSAPAIKIGQIRPEKLDEQRALALMVDNPLLIRRPLLQVGEDLRVGFDPQLVDEWIGLTERTDADLESCPKTLAQASYGHG